MMRPGRPQWLLLAGAIALIALLALVPRTPRSAAPAATDARAARVAEAVALVNGAEPMRGIMQLRAILEEDPRNVEAHWHLGLFSVRSGQYEKARERFLNVIELSGDSVPDAWYYLGRTYAMLDSTARAVQCLNTYKTRTGDPELHAEVDRVLAEIANENP